MCRQWDAFLGLLHQHANLHTANLAKTDQLDDETLLSHSVDASYTHEGYAAYPVEEL